ncbi:MAG: hypothetical protein OXN88_13210 [Chloroflexota bacterium]|nr:hypothetical protein [Chloroflexota bacterium]
MQDSEDLREIRLNILKKLFRPYIEGDATLEQVLLDQAGRIEGLDERLDRVDKNLRKMIGILRSGQKTRNRGSSFHV